VGKPLSPVREVKKMVSLKKNSVDALKHAVNGFSVEAFYPQPFWGEGAALLSEMFSYLYTGLIQVHNCIPSQ
jgi:hypothetical protein